MLGATSITPIVHPLFQSGQNYVINYVNFRLLNILLDVIEVSSDFNLLKQVNELQGIIVYLGLN